MSLWRNDYGCEADAGNRTNPWAIAGVIIAAISTLTLVGGFSYRKYYRTRYHNLPSELDN